MSINSSKFKKLVLILFIFSFTLAPNIYQIRVQADSDTIDYSEIGEGAAPAVVQISGYREVPVYELQFKDDPSGTYVEMRQVDTANKRVSSGSGFFITPNGYLFTNRHVVSDAETDYVVITGNSELEAKVVYRDPDYDLAIIKVEGGNYPIIRLSESEPDIGDVIVSIGNALGKYLDLISVGSISGLNERIAARNDSDDSVERISGLIQTDLTLYPGDSGGPLLNIEGEAVGINVATAIGKPESYSIPIDIAQTVAKRAGIIIS